MQYNNNVKFYTRSVFLTTSKLTLNFVLRLLVSDPGKNMTTRTLAKIARKYNSVILFQDVGAAYPNYKLTPWDVNNPGEIGSHSARQST